VNVRSVYVGKGGGVYVVYMSERGGGGRRDGEGPDSEASSSCYIHVNIIVSRRSQPETGGCSDNQWTCVHV
jgi:hypothetical protein